ncbi:hypothetical protein FHT93_004356 [Rhizobium sp. BK379]|nr:hypothetical protein [Rhizobium sp. BK379]
MSAGGGSDETGSALRPVNTAEVGRSAMKVGWRAALTFRSELYRFMRISAHNRESDVP